MISIATSGYVAPGGRGNEGSRVVADGQEKLYLNGVAFFRGTQMGEAARALRWRAALWTAAANDKTMYAALEALQCMPDRCAPGPLYAALDAPDRLVLDAVASLLLDDSSVSLSALALTLDDDRFSRVLDGFGLLHGGSDLSAQVEDLTMGSLGRRATPSAPPVS